MKGQYTRRCGMGLGTHAACDSARPWLCAISGTSDGSVARTDLVTRMQEPSMLYSVTGTPPGVGCFRKPPLWLKHGDVVTCEIDGIGSITNTIKKEEVAKL